MIIPNVYIVTSERGIAGMSRVIFSVYISHGRAEAAAKETAAHTGVPCELDSVILGDSVLVTALDRVEQAEGALNRAELSGFSGAVASAIVRLEDAKIAFADAFLNAIRQPYEPAKDDKESANV